MKHSLGEAWRSGRNNFNLIRLFAAWLVIYSHAWPITRAPNDAAICTVSSSLPESTTTTSSAKRADSRLARNCAPAFRVISTSEKGARVETGS